jgi:hypothetical protein
MGRELSVERKQKISPWPIHNGMVRNEGLHATGEFAGEPQPGPRGCCEVGRVDSDGEALAFNNIFDRAQAMPTARDGCGIEWCYIKLNAGGGEIDAHPVDQPAAPLGQCEPLTTIRDPCENLVRLVRVSLRPKIAVEENAQHDQRREPA